MSSRCKCQALMSVLATVVASTAVAAEPLRDPTRPWSPPSAARAIAAPDAPLRLNAVIVSGERRIAVINDRVLRVGERIGEARVLEIDDDAVWIDIGGRHQRLALSGAAPQGIQRRTNAAQAESENHEDR